MRDQRPPLGETQKITVRRGDDPLNPTGATIEYERREDAWYVKTPEDDEFWKFAQEQVHDRDVRQLVKKKWDRGYGEPDPLDDHE